MACCAALCSHIGVCRGEDIYGDVLMVGVGI